jgi:flagellar transcriptional activator FlhD
MINDIGNISEVSDLNLAYLLMAQRMVKEDVAVAMFRLGISRELAGLLGGLSLTQVVKLASTNQFLCSFRLDDLPFISELASAKKVSSLQQAHTAILLSSQTLKTAAVQ